VGEAGFESAENVGSTAIRDDSHKDDGARTDESERMQVSAGPNESAHSGDVEGALARALTLAAEAGRWDVVSQLANELERRRRKG
jgi:hypothetical protein